MTSAVKPKSVLVGFAACPLCGGKTHVKRIDAEGKKPYSHCLDEHDKGCSHTLYTYNTQQAAMLMSMTRPLQSGAAVPIHATTTPTPTGEPEAPTPTATGGDAGDAVPAVPVVSAPARRRLF